MKRKSSRRVMRSKMSQMHDAIRLSMLMMLPARFTPSDADDDFTRDSARCAMMMRAYAMMRFIAPPCRGLFEREPAMMFTDSVDARRMPSMRRQMMFFRVRRAALPFYAPSRWIFC